MLVASLLAVAALWPADSLPEFTRCATPKVPVGAVASRGTVGFLVTKRGTVDSTSLEVLAMERGTEAGLRSALWRQLPRCRFRPAHVERRETDARVTAQVHFDLDTLRVTHLALAAGAEPRIDTSGVEPSIAAGDTLTASDPRLEELPRAFDCRLMARDVVVSKVRVDGRVVENPPAPLMPPPGPPGLSPGEVVVTYVVPTEGKVQSEAIEVRRSPSNAHSSAARTRVSSCKWAPGRVAGIPVPVRIISLERFY